MGTARYLVTGGAGFIGSHLCEALLGQGCEVTVIDNLSTGRWENIAHLTQDRHFRFSIETIMNEMVIDRLVSECDVIVHLAAAVGVALVLSDPLGVLETNVLGTHCVLRSANRYRRKVLIASTSEIYGKNGEVPYREDEDRLLGPTTVLRWSYSSSKAVDEYWALAYYRKTGLPVVIMRFFNTIGPRQTGQYGMVVPRFVRQFLRGENITVYGTGQQTRSFCDVADTVRAIIGLADCPQAVGQIFNIGSANEVTICDLARRVLAIGRRIMREASCEAADGDRRIVFVPYRQAYGEGFEDMGRRIPDVSKIKNAIGWEATVSLDTTLGRVLDYHRRCCELPAEQPATAHL